MHWDLWLAQPETEQKLSVLLKSTAIAMSLWAMGTAYGLWNTRTTLAADQSTVAAHSRQLTELMRGLPEKRVVAASAAQARPAPAGIGGSAGIAEEVAALAHEAGAEVEGVRIGDGDKAQSSSAPAVGAVTAAAPGAGSAAAASTAPAAPGQEKFECNVSGEYASLSRFLNGLAQSRDMLDISALQVIQIDTKGRADNPRLEMKMSGILYGEPDKP